MSLDEEGWFAVRWSGSRNKCMSTQNYGFGEHGRRADLDDEDEEGIDDYEILDEEGFTEL